MGVMMQTFYWDCPALENREEQWWNYVKGKLPTLSQTGFTALWLPPPCKAAESASMGYDLYDYFDLGEFDQKGAVPTWFGTKAELTDLIATAHSRGLEVYADTVLNHNSGGDAQELNPIDNKLRWTKFTPKSGKFPRNYECFHPSDYETWDEGHFGDMPDLCHRNPYVYTQLIEWAQWMLNDIGFDGFRYDFVKGYGGWMVRAIQELRTLRGGKPVKPYGVGECWDSERVVDDWLDETDIWNDNPVGAFDFPLRDRLKSLCDSYGYSLRDLVGPGTLLKDRPQEAVTFVENHDIARSNPIVGDKLLAYAFVLTHEGYPCVFWQDYYNYGLAQEGTPNGIAALVRIHEDYAGGTTSILYVDDNLYIMQRNGFGDQKGLALVLNNRGDEWNGSTVQTEWPNTLFTAAAWWGHGTPSVPESKLTDASARADFWAPPRGYAVYVPQR